MFKRLSALFVALIMGLSLMAPVFADDVTPPAEATSDSTGTITVHNVPEGYSVKAYQIIKATYEDGNFLGWQWTDEVAQYSYTEDGVTYTPFSNVDDSEDKNPVYLTGITPDQLNTLVQLINGKKITVDNTEIETLTATYIEAETESGSELVYTSDSMNQGSYIILITPESTSNVVVFNPLIASVNLDSYQGENSTYNILVGGSVDASGNLTENADGYLVNQDTASASDVYAKSSEIYVEKTHTVAGGKGVDSSGNSAQGAVDKVDDAEVIEYTITTKTPDYRSEAFSDPDHPRTFNISDKLTKGLSYVLDESKSLADLKVTIGGVEAKLNKTTGFYTYTYTDEGTENTINAFKVKSVTQTTETEGGSFEIAFTDDFLKTFGSLDIAVSYKAKLNANAYTGFDPNTNTVTLEYSNDPSDTSSHGTITTRDRVYTFSINGNVYGEYEIFTIPGIDFIKVAEASSGEGAEETVKEKLEGAQFKLYSNSVDEDQVESPGRELKTVTSDKEGKIYIKGLAAGTYWLKETKAPSGYALDSTKIKIVISATYDDKTGYLTGYSITFTPEGGTAYTVSYKGEFITKEVEDEDGNKTTVIVENSDGNPMYTVKYNGSPIVIDESDVTISPEAPYEFLNTKIGSLPSTGSFGTYAFIFIGCVIMACAVTMFVSKRKK